MISFNSTNCKLLVLVQCHDATITNSINLLSLTLVFEPNSESPINSLHSFPLSGSITDKDVKLVLVKFKSQCFFKTLT